MRRPGWFARLCGRLLGFREVERSERSVLLRLPWWAKGRALDGVEEKLWADARVAWPGDELVMSRGDRLLRLSRVPRATTHLIVAMGDGVRRTVCGERADGLPVVAAVNVTCAECWRIFRAVEGTAPPSIAGLRIISDSDLDESVLGHGLRVSDAARGYDAAAMIHVTDQLTQLHDSAVTRETKRVVNRGANPVDVSTDPALVFGQGLTVAAAGGEDTVELQPGERLFGICGAALATDVAVV